VKAQLPWAFKVLGPRQDAWVESPRRAKDHEGALWSTGLAGRAASFVTTMNTEKNGMKPGEYFLHETAGPVLANIGRRVARVVVRNTGDRPVQVGSHYHFFEVNRALGFDRGAAYGLRLNIAAGTAVRFEPGEEKEVELTEFGGARVIHGCNGLVQGALDAAGAREGAIERAKQAGFLFDDGGQKR
jgi:urease subunit beta